MNTDYLFGLGPPGRRGGDLAERHDDRAPHNCPQSRWTGLVVLPEYALLPHAPLALTDGVNEGSNKKHCSVSSCPHFTHTWRPSWSVCDIEVRSSHQ